MTHDVDVEPVATSFGPGYALVTVRRGRDLAADAASQQVSGAIGVTTEYGLVLWTLRLLALRAALGGQRAHARRVAAARAQMNLSGLPAPVHLAAGER